MNKDLTKNTDSTDLVSTLLNNFSTIDTGLKKQQRPTTQQKKLKNTVTLKMKTTKLVYERRYVPYIAEGKGRGGERARKTEK